MIIIKYKEGDKVKIREDLIVDSKYGKYYYSGHMNNVVKQGDIVVIEEVLCSNDYVIRGMDCFTDEMIECIIYECDIEEYKGR